MTFANPEFLKKVQKALIAPGGQSVFCTDPTVPISVIIERRPSPLGMCHLHIKAVDKDGVAVFENLIDVHDLAVGSSITVEGLATTLTVEPDLRQHIKNALAGATP